VRAKMPNLVKLGMFKESRVYDDFNRIQRGYKLIETPLTQALLELEKILKGESNL
jgi:hypothetical protein